MDTTRGEIGKYGAWFSGFGEGVNWEVNLMGSLFIFDISHNVELLLAFLYFFFFVYLGRYDWCAMQVMIFSYFYIDRMSQPANTPGASQLP